MTAADASVVAELTTQLGYPTGPAETTERISVLLARPDDHAALVAEEDGRAVGWVHVAIYTSLESGRVATIGGLVVDEGHRSSGIGAELLAAAEEWARENGAAKMVGEIARDPGAGASVLRARGLRHPQDESRLREAARLGGDRPQPGIGPILRAIFSEEHSGLTLLETIREPATAPRPQPMSSWRRSPARCARR